MVNLRFGKGDCKNERDIPSLKLTAKTPARLRHPKRKRESLPTIHFQVRAVSFREGRDVLLIYQQTIRPLPIMTYPVTQSDLHLIPWGSPAKWSSLVAQNHRTIGQLLVLQTRRCGLCEVNSSENPIASGRILMIGLIWRSLDEGMYVSCVTLTNKFCWSNLQICLGHLGSYSRSLVSSIVSSTHLIQIISWVFSMFWCSVLQTKAYGENIQIIELLSETQCCVRWITAILSHKSTWDL